MGKKPHIVIFNPDQWRGDVLGHAGNAAAVTPHLDALPANDGVSFTSAFCQNTVCTPSRCSFMTGWYPHVRGHRTMHHMLHDELGETNLLKVLKDNGYFVWWGGKNDLVPGQSGFAEHCDVKFKATMCRTKTHKYVKRLDEPDELYDLVADPLEETNIAARPEAADILRTLKERMLTWHQETCDTVPRHPDRR